MMRAIFWLVLLFPLAAVPQGMYIATRPERGLVVCTAYIPTTASCTPNRTSATLAAPGNDNDCPGPTVEIAGPGPGACQTTDANNVAFTVNNLLAGDYRVTMTFSTVSDVVGTVSAAISDGTTTAGHQQSEDAPNSFSLVAYFHYTHSGLANKTFQLFIAASAGGTATVRITQTNTRINFAIERVN